MLFNLFPRREAEADSEGEPAGAPTPPASELPVAPAPPPVAPAAVPTPAASALAEGARRVNEIGVCLGSKRHGKTSYMNRRWMEWRRRGGSGIYVDPTGGASHLGTVVQSARHAAAVVRDARRAGRPFAVVCQFPQGQYGRYVDVFKLAMAAGDLLLCVDEVHRWSDAHQIDPTLYDIACVGRHNRVSVWVTTQLPSKLHGAFGNNWDVFVTFRQTRLRYAKIVAEEYLGIDGGAELVHNLPPFHFITTDHRRVEKGVTEPC